MFYSPRKKKLHTNDCGEDPKCSVPPVHCPGTMRLYPCLEADALSSGDLALHWPCFGCHLVLISDLHDLHWQWLWEREGRRWWEEALSLSDISFLWAIELLLMINKRNWAHITWCWWFSCPWNKGRGFMGKKKKRNGIMVFIPI